MAHIPHFGTPGYSNNPTSSSAYQANVHHHHQNSSPGSGRNPAASGLAFPLNPPSSAPQSPLSLALRRNLPAAPESPLLKPAPAQQYHTPQDSPSLKSANGNPASSGNKIKVTLISTSELCIFSFPNSVRLHWRWCSGQDELDNFLHDQRLPS